MIPNHIFGASFPCACGRTHLVSTRELVYSESAIHDLPAIVGRNMAVAPRLVRIVADKRTYDAAGERCEQSLMRAGFNARTLIIPDSSRGDPVCDEITKDALAAGIERCDLLIAAGAGVVNDLVKWISSESGIPYISVATAASMNGYASKNIAPSIGGIKRVISGTTPTAIAAVPSIIENAPDRLTAAGLGDALAKPVSATDWRLNKLLFDDYYCPLCAGLIRDIEPLYLEHPADIKARKPSAIKALFSALIYSGVSMTMADTSFPASGGEHMISHALDMTACSQGLSHDYHGRQVGLGTIFACELYERTLNIESPDIRLQTEPTGTDFWRSLTPMIEKEHAMKIKKAAAAVERLRKPGIWDEIRSTLKPLTRKASEIKLCLRDAGAAHRIEDIGCDRNRFLQAALHCHQGRERYTIVDLARAAGVLPLAAEEIIEEYLV